MRTNTRYIFICTLFFLAVTPILPVRAFQADVLPRDVAPGDAFLVKVTGTEVSPMARVSLRGTDFRFFRCGNECALAVGAVDMNDEPGNYAVRITLGHMTKHLKLRVLRPDFPTQKLTLSRDKVFLSKKNLKRVRSEKRLLQSIFRKESIPLWKGSFLMPLRNEISTAFGTRRVINEEVVSSHRGLDIRGKAGEPVLASNNGRVVLAQDLFYGGNTVVLDHGQGIYTLYMHLSEIRVKEGTFVSKGEPVGLVGSTGRSTGPHLHFGVKVKNISVNPLSFTRLMQ